MVLHTNTIAAKLYNLRCKFCCSNAHPQHTIENRTAKAHSTLIISSTYPGLPFMPRSVTLANPKNKGMSYTTFLKPIVSAEWLRQIWIKYPHAPQPSSGYISSSLHAHLLHHHLSLCNNLYKLPPYLTMCGHCNPMSLLRLWSQSHQSIPTHMLTIDDNQRDTYDSQVCLYCLSGVPDSEIQLILECPTISHVALDLIQLLTNLLHEKPAKTMSKIELCRGCALWPSASASYRQTGWGLHQRGYLNLNDACATPQQRLRHELMWIWTDFLSEQRRTTGLVETVVERSATTACTMLVQDSR